MQIKRLLKWFFTALAVVVVAVAVIAVAVPILVQRGTPGDEEYAVANVLTASANRAFPSPQHRVLFRARRGEVEISAYGFMDTESQEKVLAVLRANMTKDNPTKVHVDFFPPRVTTEAMLNGKKVSLLQETRSIRQEQL